MKKTLSLLAIAALTIGASLGAAEIQVKGNPVSLQTGTALPMGATLINSATGRTVVYDENETTIPPIEAPFNIDGGMLVASYMLSGDLPTEADELILDFTNINQYMPIPDWGSYLTGELYNGSIDVEYIVFNFVEDVNVPGSHNIDIAAWYENNPVSITGVFKNDYKTTGYLISDPCDASYPSYSRIVFFSDDVAPAVQDAEIFPGAAVPEPATATLSLLALAGLAARRRRK